MSEFWILLLVGTTTAGAYFLGRRGFGVPDKQLWLAVARVLDGVGMGMVFFTLNILWGVVLILTFRHLSGKFVSIYRLQDLSLPVLSLLQGLIFQWWREPTSEACEK